MRTRAVKPRGCPRGPHLAVSHRGVCSGGLRSRRPVSGGEPGAAALHGPPHDEGTGLAHGNICKAYTHTHKNTGLMTT